MIKKRGKKGIVVALSFAALALTSVGFSTWIAGYQSVLEITDQVTVQVADTLQLDTLNEINTTSTDLFDGSFCFDAKADDTTGPIIYSGDSGGEDLTIFFHITGNRNGAFNGIKLSAECLDSSGSTDLSDTFNGLVDTHFVSPFTASAKDSENPNELTLVYSNYEPNSTTVGGSSISVTEVELNKTSFDYLVTITFAWGSHFGGQNPGLTADESKVDTYFDYIADLKAINNARLNFTITHPATAITKS